MTRPDYSSWKPGDPISSPVERWIDLDPAAISQRDRYRLLIGSIIPRPIAFVSTMSRAGVVNLAPYSFFNGISSEPTCLVISVSRKGDGTHEKKDTLRNIEETGEFVVNSVNEWIVAPMVHCGAAYPYGVDEMKKVGLTAVPSLKIRPPRVKESAIHFECRLHKLVEIGNGGPGSTTLVIGEVVMFHIFDRAYHDGRIDPQMLAPVGRLGGFSYTLLGETFDIRVPEV